MKDEFLSNVSHELKTPLVSIKGYAEILYEETVGTLNNGQKNSLAKIVRNSERLMRMVNSLLFISAAEGEGVEYKSEKVNIQILIDEVIEDISLQAKSKNMKIEKKVSSDLPPVFGDKEKLADMLINILDNSLKFTPEEGKISISASEDKGSLHIIISDSGIGIPDELIPYLFKNSIRLMHLSEENMEELDWDCIYVRTLLKLMEERCGSKVWKGLEQQFTSCCLAIVDRQIE